MDFATQYDVIQSNKFRLPYEMPIRKAVSRRVGTFDLEHAESVLNRLRDTMVEPAYILPVSAVHAQGNRLAYALARYPSPHPMESR